MNHPQFAWITSKGQIEVRLANYDTLSEDQLALFFNKNEIRIDSFKQSGNIVILRFADNYKNLDYRVRINDAVVFAYPSMSFINNYFTSDITLGPKVLEDSIEFNIWSPTASNLTLLELDSEVIVSRHSMSLIDNGVWQLIIPKKIPFYYQIEVEFFDKNLLAYDIYAKSMAPFNYKKSTRPIMAVIEDNGNVEQGISNNQLLQNGNMELIAYETHIRDFTIDKNLGIPEKLKGTFIGLTRKIDHLVDLGITHIQLMPIQAFFTINELDRKYSGTTTPSSSINYNWGYDPMHYFIPSGFYVTDLTDPINRIKELEEMINTLHKRGIGVIIDVVYNHTYDKAEFENIAPGCYFRRNDDGQVSGVTGAGPSLESRNLMVRRLIIDSLKYFIDRFKVNGFRFDLMEFIDKDTLVAIREALGPDIILYGEAWDFTDLPVPDSPNKRNLPATFSAFNDSARDSYIGKRDYAGFILGNLVETYRSHAGIIGGIKNFPLDRNKDGVLDLLLDASQDHCFADGPDNCLNYLSIHDGLTLWDKINILADGSLEVKKKLFKQALAMLLTSQGKMILQGGTEFAHSKPCFANDPNPSRTETSSKVIPLGNIFNFHENSYRSPDCTNLILWKRKNAFNDIYMYLKNLIYLRKHLPCLHYSKAEHIRNHLTFVGENLYYTIDESLKLKSWNDIDSFTIEFINGPIKERYYLIGEAHPADSSKNPEHNKYHVDFDSLGHGSVTVSRLDLDLSAWGDPNSLQVKLVKYPGRWDFPSSSYTELGSNTIDLKSINPVLKKTVIDLAIINHKAGDFPIKYNNYIAYILDNNIVKCPNQDLAIFNDFLVIHNCAHKFSYFKRNDFLHDCRDVKVILDGINMDTTGIKNSAVVINSGLVGVPSHTSVVLGVVR